MAMVTFDEGDVTNVLRFGTERDRDEMAVAAGVTWGLAYSGRNGARLRVVGG